MNKWLKVSLSAIAIMALSIAAMGALTFSQSYAQGNSDDSGRNGIGERLRNMAQNFKQNHHGKGGRGMGHSADVVAEALGITVDELKAAREEGKSLEDLLAEQGLDDETFKANLKTAAIAQINQKVADGDMTQEKADAWIAKIESGEFNMKGRGHGKGHGNRHRGGHHGRGMGQKADVVAEALGVTVEDLQAAREEGKRLADLLAEQGLDEATFQANLKTAAIAKVNQMLADDEITQEKADAWIEKIESSEFNMNGRGFGKGHGRGDHDGGKHEDDGDTEESDVGDDEADDDDEESADADGSGNIAEADPLFRVLNDTEAGAMSLYLPMMTMANN